VKHELADAMLCRVFYVLMDDDDDDDDDGGDIGGRDVGIGLESGKLLVRRVSIPSFVSFLMISSRVSDNPA